MIVVRTVAELRRELQPARVAQKRIGFVPTMGAFHDGHLHLMRTADEECDLTVVSLFVNPTQFGDPADLEKYPRDDLRDTSLAESAGVDVLFAPSVKEMYPDGFNSAVELAGVTEALEGATRGVGHFRGVATVVLKLLNIVQPHVAYFGQKDAQQTVVVRQLIRDFNLPVETAVCPTVREHDGLAMSSRNIRLSGDARKKAVALSEALSLIEEQCASGERHTGTLLQNAGRHLAARGLAADDIEYLAAVDSISLKPVPAVELAENHAPVLFAVAARVDGVRLIDNVLVPAASAAHRIARFVRHGSPA
ncbi:MAG: pantoate--beta-alanine ligase [Phycisphaerae bacterium]|nr:pantoate--beta-alanine ligase [Gemmatimonadaceae bacterium]